MVNVAGNVTIIDTRGMLGNVWSVILHVCAILKEMEGALSLSL